MMRSWRPSLILVLAGGLAGTLALSLAGIVALRYLGPEIGFRNAAIVLGLIITAATSLLGWLLLRLLLRPILALQRYAAAVSFDSTSDAEVPAHFGTHELHQTSQNIIEMAETLRDREMTIRSFTDHVTHEIKTPVAAIKAAVELLEDGGKLSAEDLRIAREIDGAQNQIQSQLNALRAVAQARETRYIGICSLADLPRDIGGTVSLSLDGAHIKIPLSCDGLNIVLRQLIQNAAEHGASQILLRAEELTDEIRVCIIDNGYGVSHGNADRIFDPFFTTKREDGGTGMGLSIARNIIAAHHGKIFNIPYSDGAYFTIKFKR
ncbi:sensor histidine kinase [Cochlodiniinecator piscidefendens]|uniref:sensor histidine kinase n=1 Tax=Cochlodiniinecator piscidefendens TaxID=2715756 RepID=UPI00140C7A52|nr:HAMP domain-containing sensor histidine kinase [Cochlodiniinecator piscidefendens]